MDGNESSFSNQFSSLSKTSTVSQKSREWGVFKGTTDSIVEVFSRINSIKTKCWHNTILFLLEMVALVLVILLVTKDSTLYSDQLHHFVLYIYFDPLMLNDNAIVFYVVFCSFCVFTSSFIGLFFYVLYSKTDSAFFIQLFFWWSRLMRTVFLFPILHVFSGPFLCRVLDGSFKYESDGGANQTRDMCYDFDNLVFMFFSITLVSGMLFIGGCDCLFVLDKYRSSGKSGVMGWTACPSGRANLGLYLLSVMSILCGTLVEHQDIDWTKGVSQLSQTIPLIIFLMLLIRYIPWYHIQRVYITTTLLLVLIMLKVSGGIGRLTGSYIALSSLSLFFILAPMLWFVLALRYILLLFLFKKEIKSNFWLCNCATDIAIGLFVREHCRGWFGIKRVLKSFRGKLTVQDRRNVQHSATTSRNMVKLIQNMLNDEDIKKTKALCCHIITMVIHGNPVLAQAVLNHTNAIMKRSWLDVELALEIYRQKLTDLKETGVFDTVQKDKKKNEMAQKSKMVTLLNRARRMESKLSVLILTAIQELDSDDGKVVFSQFPKLLSTIQDYTEYCRNLYQRLVNFYPSALTFRKYSVFLRNFCGDIGTARIYLKESKQLEFNNNQNMTDDGCDMDGYMFPSSSQMDNSIRSLTSTKKEVEEVMSTFGTLGTYDESDEEDSGYSNTTTLDDDDDDDDEEENIRKEHLLESTPVHSGSAADNQSEEIIQIVSPEKKKVSFISGDENSGGTDSNATEEEEEEGGGDIQPFTPTSAQLNPSQRKSIHMILSSEMDVDSSHSKRDIEKMMLLQKNKNKSNKRFGGYDDRLLNKVNQKQYISALFIQVFCCLVLVYIFLACGGVFALSLYLRQRFSTTAALIKDTVDLSKHVTDVSYNIRKLQVSYYDETITPFEFERNSDVYRNTLKGLCQEFQENVNLIRSHTNSGRRSKLSEVKILLHSQIDKVGDEDNYKTTYVDEEYSLYDSIMSYSRHCYTLLSLPESLWSDHQNLHQQQVNNNNSSRCLLEETSMFFLLKNEHEIREGLIGYLEWVLDGERTSTIQFVFLYSIFPVSAVMIMCINCCLCLFYQYEQRKSFRGFLLIPKYELKSMKKRFIHYCANRQNYGILSNKKQLQNMSREGQSVDQQQEIMHQNQKMNEGVDDEAILNSLKKVDTVKLSHVQKFFSINCLMLLSALFLFSLFALIGILTSQQYVVRNLEYEILLRFEAGGYGVGLSVMEFLNRNDSLMGPTDYVGMHGLGEVNEMVDYFHKMRFGDGVSGYGGNEGDKIPTEVYYEDKSEDCVDDLLERDELYGVKYYEFLKCKSLNYKVDLLRSSALYIFKSFEVLYPNGTVASATTSHESDLDVGHDYPVVINGLDELKRSHQYLSIIMLVSFSNGSFGDMDGANSDDFAKLEEYVESKIDMHLSILLSSSIMLLTAFLPVFTIYYCCRFLTYASKLNRNLLMVKKFLMLMDRETIFSKGVYEYLTQNNYFNNNTRKIFRGEQVTRMNMFADILQMSNYGFISFDKKYNIIHFNSTADELFRIKMNGLTNMSSLFVPDSMKQVKQWAAKAEFALSGELTAIYDEQEFPVLADICRSKNKSCKVFVGLFENLESAARKDMMKNSERREENIKFLMSNVLPMEIAKTSTMDDFKLGKCKVYLHKRATGYFMDIADFSGIAGKTDPGVIIKFLHRLICNIDVLCRHHGLEKIKTIGDCYFAVSGIPTYKPLHAVKAMEFAIDVIKMMSIFNEFENPLEGENRSIQVRTGLASGEMVAGVIGRMKRNYDCFGPAVNEAARMESHGLNGKIQVSRSCYESIYEKYEFMERRIQLQGIGNDVLAYVHTPDLSKCDSVVELLIEDAMSFSSPSRVNAMKEIFSSIQKEKEEKEAEDVLISPFGSRRGSVASLRSRRKRSVSALADEKSSDEIPKKRKKDDEEEKEKEEVKIVVDQEEVVMVVEKEEEPLEKLSKEALAMIDVFQKKKKEEEEEIKSGRK